VEWKKGRRNWVQEVLEEEETGRRRCSRRKKARAMAGQ
jgi:hypothetical protein